MLERLKSFFLDKYLYLHLGVIFILALIIYLILSGYLSVYTKHGEKMPVPDLRGLTFENAQSLASDNSMEIVIYDTTYVSGFGKGEIVDHFPKPGFNVKDGRKIFVTLNSDTPPKIAMPDVVDESLRQAISIIESSGLLVGKLIYKPGYKDLVLGQMIGNKNIKPGIKVNKGTSINLVIGKGENGEKTFVPKLLGLTLAQARVQVANVGLNIEFIKFDEQVVTKKDSLDAVIWRQSPVYKPDVQIGMGANIDVWLIPADMYVPE